MTEAVRRLSSRARAETWLGQRDGVGLSRFCLLHRARGTAATDAAERQDFVESVRRLAALQHPVLEHVEAVDPQTAAFETALTPAVSGAWLLDRLRRGGREALPRPVAVSIVAQVAAALAHAFDHGVRLGGLNAERVVVGFDGDVHVVGLAEVVATNRTQVPPDAVLYGLGATLLELLTGDASRSPEPGKLPPQLDEITRRALGGGVSYGHPQAVADALEDWIAGDPQASRLDAAKLGGWIRKVAAKRQAAWSRAEEADDEEATRLLEALLRPLTTVAPASVAPPAAEPEPEPAPAVEPEPEPEPEIETEPVVPPEPVAAPPTSGWGLLLEDEADDDLLVPQASLDDVLAPLQNEQPTGDPGSAVCVEVLRVVEGAVVQVTVLHAGERYRPYRGPPLVKTAGSRAVLQLPRDAEGTFIGHLGDTRALEAGATAIELGDRVEVRHEGVTYRVRVDRAARSAGRATGTRLPWKLLLGSIGTALGLHALLLLGLVGFADRLDLRVQRPDDKEVFATLKPPSELPEAKPRPKPKERPKPKPKPKRRKVSKAAPPPDPTEARPALPERVRKKLDARVTAQRRNAKDAAEALLEALNEERPAGPGLDVNAVAKAMDAVAGPGGGDALEVAGNLGDAPGIDLNAGRGGGGDVDTLGGRDLAGKGAGKLRGRKKSGRVRGKVKTVRALTRVGCDVDRQAVRRAVTRNVGKIQACYERQLYRREGLSGKVHVEWSIDAKGRAKSVRVRVSTLGDPKVVACVLGVIRKTRFPPVKAEQCTISWPFVFSPVR